MRFYKTTRVFIPEDTTHNSPLFKQNFGKKLQIAWSPRDEEKLLSEKNFL
jgi:hypothetical protein